jgi:DNA invertase Pin-like site-specific DNA recombinase
LDLKAIASELESKGVDLIVTEQAIDTSTPTGRLMFNMLGAIAEFETDLRRDRQREGIAKAKADGRYQGRPITINAENVLAAFRAGDKPQRIARRFNIARSSVYRIVAAATP